MATKTRTCAPRQQLAMYMVWSDLEDVFEADTAYEAASPDAALQQWLDDREDDTQGHQAPSTLYCVVVGEHGGPEGDTYTAEVTIAQRNQATVRLGTVSVY